MSLQNFSKISIVNTVLFPEGSTRTYEYLYLICGYLVHTCKISRSSISFTLSAFSLSLRIS